MEVEYWTGAFTVSCHEPGTHRRERSQARVEEAPAGHTLAVGRSPAADHSLVADHNQIGAAEEEEG